MPEKNILVRLAIKNQKVRNEKGATVVEFAIIVPLLMLLIFAIIEFGFIFYTKGVVTNAAREGARVGSVFQVNSDGVYDPVTKDDISAVVNYYLGNHLPDFSSSPVPVVPISTLCPQDYRLANRDREVTVEVPFTYTFLTLPHLIFGYPLSVDLTSKSIMKCE